MFKKYINVNNKKSLCIERDYTMKKKKKSRNVVIFLITMCLIIITIYNIYVMYQNIEIADEYDTKKVSLSTNYGTNVDNSSESADRISFENNSFYCSNCGCAYRTSQKKKFIK